jgi:hypothetical protein
MRVGLKVGCGVSSLWTASTNGRCAADNRKFAAYANSLWSSVSTFFRLFKELSRPSCSWFVEVTESLLMSQPRLYHPRMTGKQGSHVGCGLADDDAVASDVIRAKIMAVSIVV